LLKITSLKVGTASRNIKRQPAKTRIATSFGAVRPREREIPKKSWEQHVKWLNARRVLDKLQKKKSKRRVHLIALPRGGEKTEREKLERGSSVLGKKHIEKGEGRGRKTWAYTTFFQGPKELKMGTE